MDENKDQPRKVSTCFDESSCAEMMQKIMGEKVIGSLSEAMMRASTKKINEDTEESQKYKERGDLK